MSPEPGSAPGVELSQTLALRVWGWGAFAVAAVGPAVVALSCIGPALAVFTPLPTTIMVVTYGILVVVGMAAALSAVARGRAGVVAVDPSAETIEFRLPMQPNPAVVWSFGDVERVEEERHLLRDVIRIECDRRTLTLTGPAAVRQRVLGLLSGLPPSQG